MWHTKKENFFAYLKRNEKMTFQDLGGVPEKLKNYMRFYVNCGHSN